MTFNSVAWIITMRVMGCGMGLAIALSALAQLRQESKRRETNRRARSRHAPVDAPHASDLEAWTVTEVVCAIDGASCLVIGANLALGQVRHSVVDKTATTSRPCQQRTNLARPASMFCSWY